jgi:ribosomal protein L11 methyltransferase
MRLATLSVPMDDGEAAADRLWTAGARAIEERTVGDRVELTTVLSDDDDVSRQRLGSISSTWSLSFRAAGAHPETWRDHVAPVVVNDELVIRPAWVVAGPFGGGVTVVAIEPGGAFGLGDHPTTRMSADAAWRFVAPGDDVLDVGCGSGVLAIVALRRGARAAVAIDVAEAAREATIRNATANEVADRLTAGCEPLAAVDGQFDLVLANILAPTLIALAPELRRVLAPGGHLVLSGVLADHHDHVIAALAPLRVIETTTRSGWACVVLVSE